MPCRCLRTRTTRTVGARSKHRLRPSQLPLILRRLLFQDDAPPLLGVLLERVLEYEGLAAERAAVRLPRGVTGGHVPLHFLPRLGAVRALGAGERPVAVAGDPVLLQLRLAAEGGAAHAALLAAAAVVHDAPVDHQVVPEGARQIPCRSIILRFETA